MGVNKMSKLLSVETSLIGLAIGSAVAAIQVMGQILVVIK